MAKEKSLTLFELLMVIIVVGILAACAFPAYQNIKADAQAKICATHLRALRAAFLICIREKEISACLAPADSTPFLNEIAQGNLKLVSCPADDHPPETEGEGAVSYGYNSTLVTVGYQNLADPTVIIADCESRTFDTPNDLAKRHHRYNVLPVLRKDYALGITKGGSVEEF
jgi:hypothetical protein